MSRRYTHTTAPLFTPIFALLMVLASLSTARADALQDYVKQPDASYSFKVLQKHELPAVTAYIVQLTSQTWQGFDWQHSLSILVPHKRQANKRAVLLIAGGTTGKLPKIDSTEAKLLANAAAYCGAVTAVLGQVPNQPMFDGLREDDLIAYSFDHYLSGGDKNWPLLLPMVKSAVRAMDTVQAFGQADGNYEVDEFIVTGASKRGWTTWLTAAVDPRVAGIVPMVIDVLNFEPQLRQQLDSYGKFSEQIRPYNEIDFATRIKTDVGQQLLKIVDPFNYRDMLTMPKLIVLGTNDPYWTVDAANLYFDSLPGGKALHYVPNAGHGLNAGIAPTMMAAFRMMTQGQPLPALQWELDDAEDVLSVQWDTPKGEAVIWQAHSTNRDFREAQWTATPVTSADQRCSIALETPDAGWSASYVEVRFPGQMPLSLSTEITVLPRTFPFAGRDN